MSSVATAAGVYPGENLARFWERQGKRVFEMYGVYWGHKKGPFFASLPFQRTVKLHAEQVDEILRQQHIGGLRFPVVDGGGIDSGLYVCATTEYDLKCVDRKQRGHVRLGLERCEIRLIDGEELGAQGLELNRDTLGRHQRSEDTFLDATKWREFSRAVGESPGMLTWGAFFDGRLSTYIIGCREGEWLHLMYKASRTADLVQYVNHALDFRILSDAAADASIQMVSSGYTSLQVNEGLDRYKRQLGYTVLEQKHAIHFHPLFEPVLCAGVPRTIARAVSQRLSSDTGTDKRAFYLSRMMEGAHMTHEGTETCMSGTVCQQEEPEFSRLARPGTLFPLLRVIQTLRQGGIGNTIHRTADFARRRLRKKDVATTRLARPLSPDESLGLQPGEWVCVKSLEEIRSTLDGRGKNRGLLFTDEMVRYAGGRFRVHKRVESIFLEESKQRRTLKNTVLLEATYCEGKNFHCDRSCLLFWKEAWLRRV